MPTAPSNRSGNASFLQDHSSRLRNRSALVFPQQIVGRLDHQGLDGRIKARR
jgi:hypothetical protein